MANLVIVESPFKAGPIKNYLGSNYKVIASYGHVRDLPKSTLGIDIENNFEPHYINIRGKGALIKEIKKEAKAANKIYLATDSDREGEAIAWHLATTLDIPMAKTLRITYNEVTKTAIKAAIKQPRQINMDLVNSQQARRIMDRVVGYTLSPLLWKNVKSGLSAGRVQSVATRTIVEREEEIRAFKAEEYWTIEATLLNESGTPFNVHFVGDRNGKLKIGNREDAQKIVDATLGHNFTVVSLKKGTRKKLPAPPFTTSTMQQEASRKLGFQSQRTMRVAQELYEGINLDSDLGGVQGLITYMRTDSLRISNEAQQSTKEFISQKYGDAYAQEKPRQYKTKAGAQDAHEAIRPSRVELEPTKIKKFLSMDQYRLYKLIWERFLASQMEAAVLNTVSADFESSGYLFHTGGYTVQFPGYMALYEESEDDSKQDSEPKEVKDIRMPAIDEGQSLRCRSVEPFQHFTEAPPRYNEASLIKFLEEKGIGRPSTYAQIITTITGRNYVTREGKTLSPTPLGEVTTKLMKEHFPDIVDYKFTAEMETELDRIESGELNTNDVLNSFWKDFDGELKKAEVEIHSGEYQLPVETTDLVCEKCGANMVVKSGRFGKFAACPNYPNCKNTKPLIDPEKLPKAEAELPAVADFKCEKCGADMVLRTGRYGSFYACSRYPECNFTKQRAKELGVNCPKCGAKLVTKYGKKHTVFYSCERYPDCDFSSWDLPLNEKCPQCGQMLFRKKGKPVIICHNKDCGYKREASDADNDTNDTTERVVQENSSEQQ